MELLLCLVAGLPRKENAKISHFISCSDVASALDMAEAIAPELLSLSEKGIEAYDAFLEQQVIVLSPLMCILAEPLNFCITLVGLQGNFAECVW